MKLSLACQRYRLHDHAGSAQAAMLWILFTVGLFYSGLYSWQRMTNEPTDGQGRISFTDVEVVREADELRLQASALVRLSSTVQAGLDSGVPLTFILSVNVREPLWLLPDRMVVDHKRHYKLTYYELTRHYRVLAIETDVSRNFRSLASALTGLGQLGRLAVELDAQQVKQMEGSGLVGSIDMRLSKSALPLPLQPIIRSSWTLASEEYRWPAT
ncbi:MAG: DUF4390 domain-containing protein [Granulosicoccus sp.]